MPTVPATAPSTAPPWSPPATGASSPRPATARPLPPLSLSRSSSACRSGGSRDLKPEPSPASQLVEPRERRRHVGDVVDAYIAAGHLRRHRERHRDAMVAVALDAASAQACAAVDDQAV